MKLSRRIRSCFRGTATVNPSAEDGSGRRQIEGHGGDDKISELVMKVRSSSSSTTPHWRPKLQAISEEVPGGVIGRTAEKRPKLQAISEEVAGRVIGRTAEKRPKKIKPKNSLRRQSSYSDDYWKYSGAIAMPAFSPTPFLI